MKINPEDLVLELKHSVEQNWSLLTKLRIGSHLVVFCPVDGKEETCVLQLNICVGYALQSLRCRSRPTRRRKVTTEARVTDESNDLNVCGGLADLIDADNTSQVHKRAILVVMSNNQKLVAVSLFNYSHPSKPFHACSKHNIF